MYLYFSKGLVNIKWRIHFIPWRAVMLDPDNSKDDWSCIVTAPEGSSRWFKLYLDVLTLIQVRIAPQPLRNELLDRAFTDKILGAPRILLSSEQNVLDRIWCHQNRLDLESPSPIVQVLNRVDADLVSRINRYGVQDPLWGIYHARSSWYALFSSHDPTCNLLNVGRHQGVLLVIPMFSDKSVLELDTALCMAQSQRRCCVHGPPLKRAGRTTDGLSSCNRGFHCTQLHILRIVHELVDALRNDNDVRAFVLQE